LLEKVVLKPEFKGVVEVFLSGVINLLKDVLVELSLYGSAACGDMHEGSDVDVLVIVKGGRGDALRALKSIYDSLGELWVDLVAEGCLLELTIICEDEWHGMIERGFSFPMNVEEDKIVLYRGS
jgi:predicted nucleotidyltransferase